VEVEEREKRNEGGKREDETRGMGREKGRGRRLTRRRFEGTSTVLAQHFPSH
jgi:hypothetical protein